MLPALILSHIIPNPDVGGRAFIPCEEGKAQREQGICAKSSEGDSGWVLGGFQEVGHGPVRREDLWSLQDDGEPNVPFANYLYSVNKLEPLGIL